MFIVGIPITTFIHEFGHALGLIMFTKNEEATIYLGPQHDSSTETFRTGRMHFYLNYGYAGFCSYTNHSGEFSKRQRILFILGGPFLSLVFCLILIAILYVSHPIGVIEGVIWWFIIANFTQFLFTIIPIRYPSWYGAYAGTPSDGYQIVKVLKRNS